jgi:hypothetical protein
MKNRWVSGGSDRGFFFCRVARVVGSGILSQTGNPWPSYRRSRYTGPTGNPNLIARPNRRIRDRERDESLREDRDWEWEIKTQGSERQPVMGLSVCECGAGARKWVRDRESESESERSRLCGGRWVRPWGRGTEVWLIWGSAARKFEMFKQKWGQACEESSRLLGVFLKVVDMSGYIRGGAGTRPRKFIEPENQPDPIGFWNFQPVLAKKMPKIHPDRGRLGWSDRVGSAHP